MNLLLSEADLDRQPVCCAFQKLATQRHPGQASVGSVARLSQLSCGLEAGTLLDPALSPQFCS